MPAEAHRKGVFRDRKAALIVSTYTYIEIGAKTERTKKVTNKGLNLLISQRAQVWFPASMSGSSKLPLIPASGDLTASMASLGNCTQCSHIQMHTHT